MQDLLDRRRLMLGALAVPALSSAPARAGAQSGDPTYERIAQDAAPLAALLPARSRPDLEAFLLISTARVIKAGAFARPRLFPMGDFAPGVSIGPIGRAGPLMLIAYAMEPGATIPAHNHPNYAVATLGVEGAVTVRHFEPVGEVPPHESDSGFQIVETARRTIRPGDCSTLTPQRDNIHTFIAGPAGAYFIDATSSHGEDVGFSYVEVPEIAPQAAALVSTRWRRFG